LSGSFRGILLIDHAFTETIPFGHRINLPIAVRNASDQPMKIVGLRLQTEWKVATGGSGSAESGGETLTLDPNTQKLIFSTLYVGAPTDSVDTQPTSVRFYSLLGNEAINFERERGEIDFAIIAKFTLNGQDSGAIPIARYRIDPKKKQAVPYLVADDVRNLLP
jgi:hypothetical protein